MTPQTITPDYPGQPLRELLSIPLPCGGRQHCGACGVLLRGAIDSPSPEEAAFLARYPAPPEGFRWRLVCFCHLHGPAEALLPDNDTPVIAAAQAVSLPAYDGDRPDSYGLAIDIGTTTITLEAYRFPGHTPICSVSEMNRQSAHGADVITRIGGDAPALHACLRTQLQDMLAQTGIAPDNISRAVLTGNTAMLHFFAGLDPTGMGRHPYTPQSLFGTRVSWDLLPQADVYLPPCITAFVGADITCGALAAGFMQGKDDLLLADVGTNGEMLMRTGGKLLCCSVAAGPAFEGAEISSGMPALPGAVDRVWTEGGLLQFHVIGDKQARGFCGTGLISALRAFLALGALEPSGAICSEENNEYLLWQEDDTPALWLPRSTLALTQRDVRKLQLVKAALAAGIQTMLSESCHADRLPARLWLAGGFGSYLDPADAAAIGMIPQALVHRTCAGGNMALQGAAMLLFSQAMRSTAEDLADRTNEIPLANHTVFQQAFIDGMEFPEAL